MPIPTAGAEIALDYWILYGCTKTDEVEPDNGGPDNAGLRTGN